ncbi:MAG: Uncharacterized protein G01um101417_67 [Parcubacteria group bacterium Gr01-1014_17]|nr:MAG: Uncharacterized protein G01um101417_67 [Parcubacteria group bacterium Gr01-1014_17]
MKKVLVSAALYAVPFVALAQTGNLGGLATTVGQIINLVIPIVGGLLLIYFFVGVIGYVNSGGDEEKRTSARNTMIYAVIGMFVAFSIFGLVKLLQNTFTGGGQGAGQNLPNVPGLLNF